MSELQGRVFARQTAFNALAEDLREQTAAAQTYLTEKKAEIFTVHHSALVKVPQSVRGKELVDFLDKNPKEETEAAKTEEAPKEAKKEDKKKEKKVETPSPFRARAKEIAEALVLSGFITSYKDRVKNYLAEAPKEYVTDNELFVPLSEAITESKDTAVWNVVDGTIYASQLKRKAGVFSAFTQGKDVYVVANEKTSKIYFFESTWLYGGLQGQGGAGSERVKQVWSDPTNYPELQQLHEKYQEEGLVVLGFPCNQFAGQEPGTHEEILEFVKQYNVTFPLFEKHDVNGSNARPVFTYLKAKLPGTFGNYIKWNFTKFLVDRNGQPYKRYAPKDLPLSFEEDIKELLAKAPEPEKAEEETKEEVASAKSDEETVEKETTEDKTEKKEEAATEEVATKEEAVKSDDVAVAVTAP
ncbi:Aldehyde dehydrogenase [Phytophthora nicotianae]|uniref:Glutathione peroxidase n=1 Tax=Phytophthora nicotianae TaxID=4792 RepID=A0A0W8DHE2_PHYNI|nr:Aldehyde dehydrogenase [Phytophthora nicotianae]